jgi:hypothetical protein
VPSLSQSLLREPSLFESSRSLGLQCAPHFGQLALQRAYPSHSRLLCLGCCSGLCARDGLRLLALCPLLLLLLHCRLPPPKYKLLQVAHRLAKVGEALLAACGSARAAFHHHFVTVGWDVLSRVFAGFLPHITGLAGLPARVTSPQQEAHTAARP